MEEETWDSNYENDEEYANNVMDHWWMNLDNGEFHNSNDRTPRPISPSEACNGKVCQK